MKVDKEQKYNVEFSKEDLKEALQDYMSKKGINNDHTILSVDKLIKTESSPGSDPHDCHYYDVFVGVKCEVSSSNE